jgi:hypothetical protein
VKSATQRDWYAGLPWIDQPNADVDGYVAGVHDPLPFDLSQYLHQWRSEGVVVFEGVVDPALIDALESDIRYLKQHYRDFELFAELRGQQKELREFMPDELDLDGVKFNSIQTISRAAALLSMTREVALFLRHVFASPPVVMQSLTFWRGSQQPIHIDYPYVRCQNVLSHLAASWIPLEDIHPDSGPLAYYPGSHRPDASGFFDWGQGSILFEPDSVRTPMEFAAHLSERMRSKGVEARVFCPRRGDVLIWHGNLAHEGTRIVDPRRSRKSYVTHYTSMRGYPAEHMKPDAMRAAHFLSAHGAYCFDFPWLRQTNKLPSFQDPRS